MAACFYQLPCDFRRDQLFSGSQHLDTQLRQMTFRRPKLPPQRSGSGSRMVMLPMPKIHRDPLQQCPAYQIIGHMQQFSRRQHSQNDGIIWFFIYINIVMEIFRCFSQKKRPFFSLFHPLPNSIG